MSLKYSFSFCLETKALALSFYSLPSPFPYDAQTVVRATLTVVVNHAVWNAVIVAVDTEVVVEAGRVEVDICVVVVVTGARVKVDAGSVYVDVSVTKSVSIEKWLSVVVWTLTIVVGTVVGTKVVTTEVMTFVFVTLCVVWPIKVCTDVTVA